MTEQSPPSIVIRLSPAQVDEVVRAAANSDVPSISTLIADTLNEPLQPAPEDQSAPPSSSSSRDTPARTKLERSLPIGTVDPRLSRSLIRGLSILTCFGPNGESRGVVEIAEHLGMSLSTTHRYALTLVELGLLERDPRTRKYRLHST